MSMFAIARVIRGTASEGKINSGCILSISYGFKRSCNFHITISSPEAVR